MGYMVHDAIIVTCFDEKDAKYCRDKAVEIFDQGWTDPANKSVSLVGPIMVSKVNAYATFFIGPDGSKLGWSDSERGDECRKQYIEWLRSLREVDKMYADWVEVQYGDDNGDTRIVSDSDENRRL